MENEEKGRNNLELRHRTLAHQPECHKAHTGPVLRRCQTSRVQFQ